MLNRISNNKIKTSILLSLSLNSILFSICGCSNAKKVALLKANVSEDTKFKAVIIDNVTIDDFNNLGFKLGDSCDVVFSNGYKLLDIPYFDGYYVKTGAPLVVGYASGTTLKVAFNNGTLWDEAKLTSNDTVDITLNTAGKYLNTQETLAQSYSLDREKYPSDEAFVNFRPLSGGNLKADYVYRGASPVDDRRKRTQYTDKLLENNGIKYIIDLADTLDEMKEFVSSSTFASPYTKSLYEDDKIVFLGMSSNYSATEYRQSVATGFKKILTNDGPFYIHCLEGKDRTGFVCVVLEALLGASYDELLQDYMKTYENYYGITKEKTKEKYDAVVSVYFNTFMEFLHNSSDVEVLKKASYVDDAKSYLESGGMTEKEIEDLIKLLSK